MIELHTTRLRLREFTASDAAMVLRLLNEPSFHEFIGDRGIRTLAEAEQYLQQGPCASYVQHGHGLLHVSLAGDGSAIGMCGLLKRDGLDHADVGFALFPEFWNRGYTTEAARAVMAHGRDTLGLGALLAITSPHNLRSIHVLGKLGFAFVECKSLTANASAVNVYRSMPTQG
ncbi:MAG: N-acetyltransferase [Gammaproteobacteria bacterium]|jgi:ribosomal-protein-alanine N-acetyltransferase|nr:N-acetyltransferase [Gammaproteobacteria bacterium]NBX39934.1 N-acetyltransferase [Gammaproteobacteria bacterium]